MYVAATKQEAAAFQAALNKQKINMLQQLATEVMQAKIRLDEWRNISLN